MSFSSATTVFSEDTYGSSLIHSQCSYQQCLCRPLPPPPSPSPSPLPLPPLPPPPSPSPSPLPPPPPHSLLPSVLPYICSWTLIGSSEDFSVGQNWRLETTRGLDSWNLKGHDEGMSPISSLSHLEHSSTENFLRGFVPGTPSEGRSGQRGNTHIIYQATATNRDSTVHLATV